MKKFLISALTLLMLTVISVSCQSTNDPADSTESSEPVTESEENTMISLKDSADYVILYPNDGFKEKYLALLVSNALYKETGLDIVYKADAISKESEYEILIGNTDRAESQVALELMGDNDLIVTVINKKIVICTKSDELYYVAVYHLINSLSKDGTHSLPADLCIIKNPMTLNKVSESFTKDTSIYFEASFANSLSSIDIRIGSVENSGFRGYVVRFTPESTEIFQQASKKTELAKKVTLLKLDTKYNFSCSYDGEYVRAYVSDPTEGVEPWAAFEIKLPELEGSIFAGESSGYGGYLSEIKLDKLDSVAIDKYYQNNVIANAADPDIIYHNGYYYMYVTGDHYPVYRSADLAKWEYVGLALPEVSWNIDKRYMWAPDVEYINGKFYMAVTMGEAGFGIAVADKPEGPFVCAGDMPFLTQTIDGHIFVDDDGRIYLYYTSWCNGRAYGIWGVEMDSDCLTPKWETEKLIFTPTEDWEKTMNMGAIVEAPYMLKKDGIYYLVYSGSNYQADYAVGYATSSSPLEGFVKSENNPILRGTADTRCTGHCSIITTPAGKMVMVYHVHNSPSGVQPRHVAIDPVRFVKTADGYRLEVCGPTTSKRPLDIFE